MNLRVIVALCTLVACVASAKDWHVDEGRWRIELTGFGGVYSGKTDRSEDGYISGTVDYEIPAFDHASLSLRLRPLFVYFQDENDDDDSDTIWGGGVGFATRFYQHQDDMTGWFADLGVGMLWHSRYFKENTSRINFTPEVGIGYQFKNDWSIVLRGQHLSNAGTAGKNAGVNAVGLAIGYRF